MTQFPKHFQSLACCNTPLYSSWMIVGALGGHTCPVGLVQLSQITSNNSIHLCWGNWIEPIKSRRFLFWISLFLLFLQLLPVILGCHWEGDTCCALFQALSALVTYAVSLLYSHAYFKDTCSHVVISETPSFYQTWLKMAKVIWPVIPSLDGLPLAFQCIQHPVFQLSMKTHHLQYLWVGYKIKDWFIPDHHSD